METQDLKGPRHQGCLPNVLLSSACCNWVITVIGAWGFAKAPRAAALYDLEPHTSRYGPSAFTLDSGKLVRNHRLSVAVMRWYIVATDSHGMDLVQGGFPRELSPFDG